MLLNMKGKIREIKREIRVIGIDDGPFNPARDRKCLLIGAIYRGCYSLEGVEATFIDVDGTDVTNKIVKMITGSKHKGQLRTIMLSGITFAGFNVADPFEISERTGLPVITMIEKEPDLDRIRDALQKLPNYRLRWQIIRKMGMPLPLRIQPRRRPLYVQPVNISLEQAKEIIEKTRSRSAIPEPLRVAHLISSAIAVPEP
ncbi:MAG: endonuclease dU [Thermoproteota archaeon]